MKIKKKVASQLCQALDNLNATYENITLIENFNVELNEAKMSDFLNI